MLLVGVLPVSRVTPFVRMLHAMAETAFTTHAAHRMAAIHMPYTMPMWMPAISSVRFSPSTRKMPSYVIGWKRPAASRKPVRNAIGPLRILGLPSVR